MMSATPEEVSNSTEARPPLWRWLVGTVIILFSWLVVGGVLTAVTAILFNLDINALVGTDDESRALVATYPPWQAAAAILISFLPLLVIPILLHRFLLKREISQLFSRSRRPLLREVGIGAAVMALILLITGLPDFIFNNSTYQLTFELSRFLPYLLLGALLIPVQTSAEEVFFRGWIQQRLEKPGRSIWLISALGGLLFAAPHLGNPEVNGELFFAVLGYGSTGFMLAWVSMRDQSIGIAMGAHAANNLMAGLIVTSVDSALPAASIWTTPAVEWTPAAIVSILIVPIFIWLTGRWNSKVVA